VGAAATTAAKNPITKLKFQKNSVGDPYPPWSQCVPQCACAIAAVVPASYMYSRQEAEEDQPDLSRTQAPGKPMETVEEVRTIPASPPA
jgi:hypothetical protein